MSQAHDLELVPLRLEDGTLVDPHRVRGWDTGGEDRPVVLVIHALTGDARADRWWAGVVGGGKALDPARYRLVSFNLLGSCYGSSGPPPTGSTRSVPSPSDPAAGGWQPTTWDLARSLLLALDRLDIDRLHLVTGGSLGAMVSLCLAVLAPERVERVMPIAGCLASTPWIVGWNHIAREVLDAARDPEAGLALARQIAMMTYRAPEDLARRPARAVRAWLDHHGEALVRRFTRPAYRAMLSAMDRHDVERWPGWPQPGERWHGDPSAWGLSRLRASVLALGITSDHLFPHALSKEIARRAARHTHHARYRELESAHGHDAFLIEWHALAHWLREAMAMPSGLTDGAVRASRPVGGAA